MHTLNRFIESQQQHDNAIEHIQKFKLNGKDVTLACIQTDSSDPPHYQHMEMVLDGKEVHVDAWILEYEIKDKWLLVHSATDYSHTSTSRLIDMETHESRLLTNIEGGWNPDGFAQNNYMCIVDFEKERVTFTHNQETKTFKEVFECPNNRVVADL